MGGFAAPARDVPEQGSWDGEQGSWDGEPGVILTGVLVTEWTGWVRLRVREGKGVRDEAQRSGLSSSVMTVWVTEAPGRGKEAVSAGSGGAVPGGGRALSSLKGLGSLGKAGTPGALDRAPHFKGGRRAGRSPRKRPRGARAAPGRFQSPLCPRRLLRSGPRPGGPVRMLNTFPARRSPTPLSRTLFIDKLPEAPGGQVTCPGPDAVGECNS